MNHRHHSTSNPVELNPGDTEMEMGIPIPGIIVERERWTQTALKKLPVDSFLNWHECFSSAGPIAIDIGCGNGRFTISSAVRRPDWNHLGIDILPAVIRYATRRGNQRGLTNARFAVSDGWKCLESLTPPDSVNEIHIYHPQPFASPNDASKRMLTPQFVALIHSRLTPDGRVFLQTDRLPYWKYIRNVFSRVFHWHDQLEPWPEDPHGRSRRELLSREQKLTIYRGIGTKNNLLTLEDVDSLLKDFPQPEFKIETSKHFKRRRR